MEDLYEEITHVSTWSECDTVSSKSQHSAAIRNNPTYKKLKKLSVVQLCQLLAKLLSVPNNRNIQHPMDNAICALILAFNEIHNVKITLDNSSNASWAVYYGESFKNKKITPEQFLEKLKSIEITFPENKTEITLADGSTMYYNNAKIITSDDSRLIAACFSSGYHIYNKNEIINLRVTSP